MKTKKPLDPLVNVTAVQVVPDAVVTTIDDTAVSTIDDTDDLHNPDLIWCRPAFPHRTNMIGFTPGHLYATLIAFADTVTPFTKFLFAAGIEYNMFCRLSDRYPEISVLYAKARVQRAQKWGDIAETAATELPKDESLYQIDENGHKMLTNAGATVMKNRIAAAHRIAAICETGTFITTSKQETINRNLSMNVTFQGKLPDNFDLATADTASIVDAIKGRKAR